MDADAARRIARALEAALAVFRDAKGRLSASDIRVQSILAAIRGAIVQQIEPDLFEWPGRGTSRSPFRPLWNDRPPEQRT